VISSLVLENSIPVDGAFILRYENPRGITHDRVPEDLETHCRRSKSKNLGDGWFSDIQDVVQAKLQEIE